MAKKEAEKKFVVIHSDVTIAVTPGLQNKNVTDNNSRVGDKLRVIPQWPLAAVQILAGKGVYPSEIVKWFTVQKLVEKGILTISDYVDDPAEANLNASDMDKKVEKAKKDEKKLEEASKILKPKLEDIAEE